MTGADVAALDQAIAGTRETVRMLVESTRAHLRAGRQPLELLIELPVLLMAHVDDGGLASMLAIAVVDRATEDPGVAS
jgi:hypothetical protein